MKEAKATKGFDPRPEQSKKLEQNSGILKKRFQRKTQISYARPGQLQTQRNIPEPLLTQSQLSRGPDVSMGPHAAIVEKYRDLRASNPSPPIMDQNNVEVSWKPRSLLHCRKKLLSSEGLNVHYLFVIVVIGG